MSRFGRIPGFCQFLMEKKDFAVEMKALYDFLYFLMHTRPFEGISNYNKTNLLGIYIFKVDNKNTRARYETCLKLKLKNEYIRATVVFIINFEGIIYQVLAFLLLTLNIEMTDGNAACAF